MSLRPHKGERLPSRDGGAGRGPAGRLLKPLDGVGVLDDLDGVGCELARGHELELGLVAEVLAVEEDALAPSDVDLLDVVDGEVLGGDCAFGGEAGGEGAHVAEGHAVAFEDELAQAVDGLHEDGVDVAGVVDASVVGDVLGELVEGEVLANLRLPVGFGVSDLLLLGAGLCALDADTVVNHSC